MDELQKAVALSLFLCSRVSVVRVFLAHSSFMVPFDPPDEKRDSELLLSRRTYPPRDSWNFYTKSPLTTNQKKNNQMKTATNYGSWPRQRPRRRGDRSNREGLDGRFYSWAAVSRSRGRSAPCPPRWAENKTASERTFVRFFSTKHGSLRITVGRWIPKETPIRSAPRLGGIYLIPITRRGSP
ncbi:hypothetical protein BDE02_13G058000 [Populus trichocarpa]|nr:hypothetical protein BDE02_13G058000 [Populus trichocarpa]